MQIGIGLGLVTQALGGVVTDNALNDYGTPHFLADFIESEYRNNGPLSSSFTALTGLTFTRASTGYARTAAGVLVPFASGAPRITDKGLLIEGARTNLCLRSQEFDNASWTKNNCTVTADQAVAPDGTQTADLLTASATGSVYVQQGFTGTAASYAFTYIAKAGTCSRVRIVTNDGTTSVNSWFDIANGVVGTVGVGHTATITPLANGFYACSVVATMAASASCFSSVRLASADNSSSANNGTTIYLWGAQVELGGFRSSYIPTTTTSVTRAADVASIAVSGLAYPLTMFAEFSLDTVTGGSDIINLDTLTNGSGIYDTSGVTRGWVRTSSVTTANVPGGVAVLTANTIRRAAARMQNDNVNASYGGAIGTADTVAGLSYTPTNLTLFGAVFGGQGFGYLRRAAIWPTAFTDANLQAVTA